MGGLVFILILAAVGAVAYLSYRAKRRRRESLLAFAERYGLEYSRTDPFAMPLSYGFRLFGMGDGRGCENVVSGLWEGLPVKEADYWYYERSSEGQGRRTSKRYSYFSVVVADLPGERAQGCSDPGEIVRQGGPASRVS